MSLEQIFDETAKIVATRLKFLHKTSLAISVLLGIWVQVPAFKVMGYRPEDDLFFYSIVGSSLIVYLISKCISRFESNQLKTVVQDHAEKIKYYEDVIFQERTDSLNDHLREIAENPENAFGMTERICLYRYSDSEDVFYCVGRYSQHPDYLKNSERKQYPSDSGIIASVWRDGQHNGIQRDSEIPSIGDSKSAYFTYLREKYNIPREVAQKFRMNPVDIVAQVIRDTKNKAIAIIVFESQRKKFLKTEAIKKSIETKNSVIVAYLDKLQEQRSPDINYAREVQL